MSEQRENMPNFEDEKHKEAVQKHFDTIAKVYLQEAKKAKTSDSVLNFSSINPDTNLGETIYEGLDQVVNEELERTTVDDVGNVKFVDPYSRYLTEMTAIGVGTGEINFDRYNNIVKEDQSYRNGQFEDAKQVLINLTNPENRATDKTVSSEDNKTVSN